MDRLGFCGRLMPTIHCPASFAAAAFKESMFGNDKNIERWSASSSNSQYTGLVSLMSPASQMPRSCRAHLISWNDSISRILFLLRETHLSSICRETDLTSPSIKLPRSIVHIANVQAWARHSTEAQPCLEILETYICVLYSCLLRSLRKAYICTIWWHQWCSAHDSPVLV